eukprot:13318595-Alexandrium_andersonii.AAC.1
MRPGVRRNGSAAGECAPVMSAHSRSRPIRGVAELRAYTDSWKVCRAFWSRAGSLAMLHASRLIWG